MAVGDSGSCVQLLAPLSPESTIAKFLDRTRPGLQQVAYRVADVDAVSARRCASAGCACSTTSRGAAPRAAGSTSSTPRTPAASSSSWSSPPRLTDAPAGRTVTPAEPAGLRGDARRTGRFAGDARSRCGGGLTALPAGAGPPLGSPPRTPAAPVPAPRLPAEETTMQAIREAILSGERDAGDLRRRCRSRRRYRAVTVHRDEEEMFAGLASRDKDPRKSLHVEEVAGPRARPRRGARRRDGQRDQLQHRLDLDLRAGLDVHLPASATAGPRRSPGATTCPTTWSAPTCPASSCAPAPGSTPGSPATRWSRTACRSSWSTPTATTTRCSTPSSGSGASRPTSAAWPSSPWSRPTS